MYQFLNNKIGFLILLLGIGMSLGSCKKSLPTDRDYFDKDAQFSQEVYMPVVGRNNLFSNNFNPGTSSQPMTFKIINPRRRNGDPAPELTATFPVLAWSAAYTGKEKSLEEIEAKRVWENHPLFEIREHSGQLIMWAAATSNIIHCQPDSGYLFDVEVSNSGGRRYYQDLKLIPFRERPYEPTNQNAVTGTNLAPAVHPSQVENVTGRTTGRTINSDDISIFFHKTGDGVSSDKSGSGGSGSLTFRFLDSALHPINPSNFNLTDWVALVHGFNMEKTETYVKYDVAYPIPLITMPTQYTTNDGSQAKVNFSYARQGVGNIRVVANIGFNFNIYEKGDWEIVFWFNKEDPKFKND